MNPFGNPIIQENRENVVIIENTHHRHHHKNQEEIIFEQQNNNFYVPPQPVINYAPNPYFPPQIPPPQYDRIVDVNV